MHVMVAVHAAAVTRVVDLAAVETQLAAAVLLAVATRFALVAAVKF
jgi:hypothetical protein